MKKGGKFGKDVFSTDGEKLYYYHHRSDAGTKVGHDRSDSA